MSNIRVISVEICSYELSYTRSSIECHAWGPDCPLIQKCSSLSVSENMQSITFIPIDLLGTVHITPEWLHEHNLAQSVLYVLSFVSQHYVISLLS